MSSQGKATVLLKCTQRDIINKKVKRKGWCAMGAVMCLSLGYILGTLSPSALIAKLKKVNLREEGSGNLGATNTMLVMGFRYGLFVLLFDLFKTILANRLAKLLFPQLYLAGLLAACGAVIGHISRSI